MGDDALSQPRQSESVKACPNCGRECRVYKCECDGHKHDPVEMPSVVAERLQELHRKAFPPRRLTASPAGFTVWVESDRVLLRHRIGFRNTDAVSDVQQGWAKLTHAEWAVLRDCVDHYVEAFS